MANAAKPILSYLQSNLPSYPYDEKVDTAFVEELVNDFQDVNILDEIKAFRWFHDNDPAKRVRTMRLTLRRWIAGVKRNRYKPSAGVKGIERAR